MKISERIGQLLDVNIAASVAGAKKRKRIADFLRECNKGVNELAMNSKDKERIMDYINLYQDIEAIAQAIEFRMSDTLMDKDVSSLESFLDAFNDNGDIDW